MARLVFARRICVLLTISALGGCKFSEYGAAANYSHFSTAPVPVQVPSNAPSIYQQFRHLTHNREARESEGDHLGIDIRETRGFPVLSVAAGRVAKSYHEPSFGNRMVVEHDVASDGTKLVSVYKHLQIRQVAVGTRVERGQQIATLGSTGMFSGGIPHLHFELYAQDQSGKRQPVDPNFHWVDGTGLVTCFNNSAKIRRARFGITYPVPCKN